MYTSVRYMIVKHFERSNGLDTALYKNVLFLVSTTYISNVHIIKHIHQSCTRHYLTHTLVICFTHITTVDDGELLTRKEEDNERSRRRKLRNGLGNLSQTPKHWPTTVKASERWTAHHKNASTRSEPFEP